jgi:hypothetical protein
LAFDSLTVPLKPTNALSITPVRFRPQSNASPTKNSISPLGRLLLPFVTFAQSMSSSVTPKIDLCWKRRQHKPSALADSLRNSASKPDVSGIETAIAKRRSQKFLHSPIQPKEEPGWSRQTAHCIPQPTSVTARLYIRAAFSAVCLLEERHIHPPSGPLP